MSGWKVTYVGEGVKAIEGVGVFQRHTRATVSEDVAKSLQGDASWQVTAPDQPPAPVAAAAPPAAAPAPAEPAPAPAAPAAEPAAAPKADAKKDAKADDKKDAKADAKKDDKAAGKKDEAKGKK